MTVQSMEKQNPEMFISLPAIDIVQSRHCVLFVAPSTPPIPL